MPRRSGAAYGRSARYYDLIYHGFVDYEGDVDFLENVFRRYRVRPKTVLDIGCGTGNHDFPLARRGYDVTGIDQSNHMLDFARKKAARITSPPRFVHANMQSFRLPKTFDAVVCMFGAFGYLLRQNDVTRCVEAVRAHLVSRGLFIFEYWQTSGVRPGIQSWIDRIVEGREIVRLSEAQFDPRKSALGMDFRFLVLRDRKVLDDFSERHVVRTYTREAMNRLLRRRGFNPLAEFAATPQRKMFRSVTPGTFRIMEVARAR